jgi:hypothetical protein
MHHAYNESSFKWIKLREIDPFYGQWEKQTDAKPLGDSPVIVKKNSRCKRNNKQV